MNDIQPPRRPKKSQKARDNDPFLWVIVLISVGVIGTWGAGQFMKYRDAQQANVQFDGTPMSAPNPQQAHELSPELRGTDRPGGMEAGTFTSIDAASDIQIRSTGPNATTTAGRSTNLSQDCASLKKEQEDIEARLRRPIGAHTAEQLKAQLEEISTTAQRAGC
jgi:hypothetical protein